MIGPLETFSLLQAGGGPFATVRVIQYKGRKAVLKDYSRSRPIFRHTCGAYMTRREAAAYHQIHDIPGIPRFHGCVGRDGLLLEYIDGRNALQSPPSSFDPGFFLQLSEILSAIRARGVLHCDVVRNVCRTP